MKPMAYQIFKTNFRALSQLLLDIDHDAWSERQAAIPVGQILLAAGLLDIDCCPMEGFFYKKVGKILSEVGLLDSKQERLDVAIAFGYRKEEPKRPKTRRPMSEILTVI